MSDTRLTRETVESLLKSHVIGLKGMLEKHAPINWEQRQADSLADFVKESYLSHLQRVGGPLVALNSSEELAFRNMAYDIIHKYFVISKGD